MHDIVFYAKRVVDRKYYALGLAYIKPLELFGSLFKKMKIQKLLSKNQLAGT